MQDCTVLHSSCSAPLHRGTLPCPEHGASIAWCFRGIWSLPAPCRGHGRPCSHWGCSDRRVQDFHGDKSQHKDAIPGHSYCHRQRQTNPTELLQSHLQATLIRLCAVHKAPVYPGGCSSCLWTRQLQNREAKRNLKSKFRFKLHFKSQGYYSSELALQ